jgi:molybdopterin converting factor small subunit|tara:strand:+ start:4339 stop:4596 length:258 start_codon:yes stop_codon:yes gene_type:complete
MINVKALGSIGKTLGNDSLSLNEDSLQLITLLKKIFNLDGKNGASPEILNDIIVAINGVAVSKKIDQFILKSGDEVTLIPISHGG